jgi:hypothetical protein
MYTLEGFGAKRLEGLRRRPRFLSGINTIKVGESVNAWKAGETAAGGSLAS